MALELVNLRYVGSHSMFNVRGSGVKLDAEVQSKTVPES